MIERHRIDDYLLSSYEKLEMKCRLSTFCKELCFKVTPTFFFGHVLHWFASQQGGKKKSVPKGFCVCIRFVRVGHYGQCMFSSHSTQYGFCIHVDVCVRASPCVYVTWLTRALQFYFAHRCPSSSRSLCEALERAPTARWWCSDLLRALGALFFSLFLVPPTHKMPTT